MSDPLHTLDLPGVTLVCADTANHALALRAIAKSCAGVRYGRMLFLTDALPPDAAVPEGVEVAGIAPITSREAYSELMLKALLPHIDTPHALVVQWDGYVVNPAAWDPAFLDCDYIGAKWHWFGDGMRIGNGGFSLRSRKLLEALRDPRIELVEVEDSTIGRTFRPLLERDYAIRYADEALADRFSFEAAYPIGRPFGFHGLFNFCRTVPPAEIAAMAPGFSDAIARSPQLLSLLRNCMATAQWNAARAIARRMLDAAPGHAEAQVLLTQAERGATQGGAVGRNDPCPCGSGKRYKQCHGAIGPAGAPAVAAPSTPPDVATWVQDAIATHQRGELDAAESAYRAALATAPGNPTATHYLGVVLYQRGRLDEALPLLRAAADAVPQEPEFHNNLGLALAAADYNDESIAAFRRTLALKPDHAIACNNLGLSLQAGNRLPEAIAAFRDALAHVPDFAQAHWNLALALLAHGEFADGWRQYEWRLQVPEFAAQEDPAEGPRWDGVVRAGQTLLLTAEQGLGDTLQFIRFARPLAEGGMRVLVRAQPPLIRLLATVPGVAGVSGSGDTVPAHDAHAPVMSVAGALGVTPATIPSQVPYLTADPVRRAKMGVALATKGRMRKVGLAWTGSKTHANDRRRSMALATMAPLFEVPGVDWFTLQREDDGFEAASVPAARVLTRLTEPNDFDDTAALVAELDLVITVDTAIAHLAGALAKPTWILLPFAPDWRWRLDRADTPWYPTARLFRQPRLGDWDAVVRELVGALRGYAAR